MTLSSGLSPHRRLAWSNSGPALPGAILFGRFLMDRGHLNPLPFTFSSSLQIRWIIQNWMKGREAIPVLQGQSKNYFK